MKLIAVKWPDLWLLCMLLLASGMLFSGRHRLDAAPFVRGDVDAGGAVNLTDAVGIFSFLFTGGSPPTCLDAADADDEGGINITDGIYILNYLFIGGPPPLPPFPACGEDLTLDSLGCENHEPCRPDVEPGPLTFFGIEFTADGVFFVVDRGSGGNAGLNVSRPQILKALSTFVEDNQFIVSYFDQVIDRYPPQPETSPADAGPEEVRQATEFVRAMQPGRGSCLAEALVDALEVAGFSDALDRVVLLVTDGQPRCGGGDPAYRAILAEARAVNVEGIPIHVFGVNASGVPENFLKAIANDSGGTYTPVRGPVGQPPGGVVRVR